MGRLGSPKKDVANLFWSSAAAPWETVDDCRSWVEDVAADNNDPTIKRGGCECGVGKIDGLGDAAVYRLTAR